MAHEVAEDHNSSTVVQWPEPIQYVQELAESGILSLPPRYVRSSDELVCVASVVETPPVIDLSALSPEEEAKLSHACREWGVFQVVNHGINRELMMRVMEVSQGFFALPMDQKLEYRNDPMTYMGYGSRMGVKKGVTLDWNDYFIHSLWPLSANGSGGTKWPNQPTHYREAMKEYGESMMGLCKKLLSMFSKDLGLEENSLLESFGGEGGLGTYYRMNYYPKCPQPELALGLTAHTDPGCFSLILQNQVSGLHVKKGGVWASVPPIEDALVVNIGDQLEVVSNGIYKSVEHRTVVNGEKVRMSMVVIVIPERQIKVGPHPKLVQEMMGLSRYSHMTFTDHRKSILTLGSRGSDIIDDRKITTL